MTTAPGQSPAPTPLRPRVPERVAARRRGRRDLRRVYEELARAQKPPAKGSPAYSRFVNRRLGRVLAAGAARMGLRPNQVTGISGALSGIAIVLIPTTRATVTSGIGIAVLLLLGYAFDSADGQLARLFGGCRASGEWLDHVIDSIKIPGLHLAVAVVWVREGSLPDGMLLVPMGFALTGGVLFFAQILTDHLRRAYPAAAPRRAAPGRAGLARSLLVMPTDYGLLCLAFLTFGWPPGFVVLYTGLFACTLAFALVALPTWFVELERLRPTTSAEA